MVCRIRDFDCGYGNSVGISPEVTADLGLEFPDAYLHASTMKTLARAVREHDGAGFCLLPFCRTVEAEAMGADINLGNADSCPRAGSYICTEIDELMELPGIDFSKGRIHETLRAAGELKAEGDVVAFEIAGPFSLLNNVIDARVLFRALRKQPQNVYAVLEKLACQLLLYVDEIKKRKADIIIVSDSAGAPSILGPKMTEQVVENFACDFVRHLAAKADENTIFLLCPKLVFALIDTGHAEFVSHDLGRRVDYLEALLEMKGTAKLAGQTCIKNIDVELGNGVFEEVIVK